MPLTPNFTSTESLPSPNLVTFTDTSLGSDGTITTRTVTLVFADGSTVTYTGWDYANASIQLDIITKSTTANVTVTWYAGVTPVYTKTILMEWDNYDYLFLFYLLQMQTAHPRIIDDTSYYPNAMQMIVNLFNSENAVARMDDLYSSQASLDNNYYFIQNQNLFF